MNAKKPNLQIPADFHEQNVPKNEQKATLKSPSMFSESNGASSNTSIKKMVTPFDIISGHSNSEFDNATPQLSNTKLVKAKSKFEGNPGNSNAIEALNKQEYYRKKCMESEKIIKQLEEQVMLLKREIEKFEEKQIDHDKKVSIDATELKTLYEKYFTISNEYEMEKSSLKFRIEELEQCISEMEEQIKTVNLQLLEKHLEYEKLQDSVQKTILEKKKMHSTLSLEMERNNELLKQLKSSVIENEIINTEQSTLLTEFMLLKEDLGRKSEEISSLNHTIDNNLSLLQHENEKIQREMKERILYQERFEMVDSKYKTLEQLLLKVEQENADLKKNDKSQGKQLNEALRSIESLQNELNVKLALENELQITLKQLHCNNKHLNIRLDALSELITMQETKLNSSSSVSKTESLLNLWRQKVYELLVLLKSQEV